MLIHQPYEECSFKLVEKPEDSLKQLLTAATKKKRMKWAKKYKNWRKEDWKKVIFSDESHFEGHGPKFAFAQRSASEPINSRHIQQAPKYPLKKMFWGCFTFQGTGRLCPVEGMMNSTKYHEMLTSTCLQQ